MSPRYRCISTLGSVIIAAAIVLAAPQAANAHDLDPADFQQVTLAKGVAEVGEPMAIAVLPDSSVLHTARNGTLRRTDKNGTTTVIGTIAVYTHDEEGLQGVGIDPGFATNRQIYLYYAPPLSTPAGDAPATGTNWSAWQGVNRLSRFTLNADFTLNTGSKVDVLDVPADRGLCCHVGGDIDFDAAGNLYLSTGDDSNPFESAGYSPLDERTDRNPAYDAQRSAGNTNDLRGKVLRIKVNANGSYSIPAGNLFPQGTANTRPEIYAMGFRNPFRMSVDKATGIVYLGDYGPDAGSTSANRGPSGQVEFNRITSPGNYGWPYCTGTNTSTETYNEWDFAANTGGAKYNCAGGPTNNSFRNTGQTTLPPARPAWIRYAGDAGSPPEFGGGSESPMGGPVYRYDAALNSPTKFPEILNGHFFAGEFGRGWVKPIHVNADGSVGEISTFAWNGKQVMDMAFGPEGSLYVLDYGTGYFNGDANSALYRYDYLAGQNRAPTAVAAADKTSGQAPLTVVFSSAGSSDPEGGALTYSWNFGDGTTSTSANPTKTYTTNGTYNVTLTVRDPDGATGNASVQIGVGNTAPTVTINAPANGQLFSYGDTVPFSFTATDPEDGTINCARAKMTYVLGHDSHGHQITSVNGCSGSITIPVDGEHDDAANIFAVFDAEYTDAGGLITHTQHILQPRHRQAEHFKTSSGHQHVRQGHGRGRQDGRRHQQRRLDRVQPVQAEQRHVVHRPGLLGRRGRHAADPGRLGDRHGARLGHRPGDRRLGHLRERHRHGDRRPGRHHHAVPDLRGHRHRRPVRPGRLHPEHHRDHRRHRPDPRPGEQVPGRQQRRDRRRHEDPALHLQRHHRTELDGDPEQHDQGARQVPGCGRRRHRERHQGPALDLQRHRSAELVGAGRRLVEEPAVRALPGRVREQPRRRPADPHLGLPRRGQPEVGAAMIGKLLAALILLPAAPVTAAAADDPYDVLVFSKTAGFRHDAIPAGVQSHPGPGRRQRLHGHRHRGRQRVHHREPRELRGRGLPEHHRRRAQRRPADGVRVLHPQRQGIRRRARGGRHRVRLAVLRRTGRGVLRVAPGDPAGQRQGGGPGARGDRASAADLEPHRRVVQLPHQLRVRPPTCWPRSTRARTPAAGWAPTTRIAWCKTYSGGRSFYTGGGHTQESYADPAFRAHLLGGIRYAAGQSNADCRPGDRIHRPSTTDRPPAGRRPARAASPTPTPRSPRPAAWACTGTRRSSSRTTR